MQISISSFHIEPSVPSLLAADEALHFVFVFANLQIELRNLCEGAVLATHGVFESYLKSESLVNNVFRHLFSFHNTITERSIGKYK